ncbi:MAG: hypothetical protein CL925_15380 [Deltaproteobacteria bacterium]|nr:hypothetical protein [Deltaproteobacteria bacterium]
MIFFLNQRPLQLCVVVGVHSHNSLSISEFTEGINANLKNICGQVAGGAFDEQPKPHPQAYSNPARASRCRPDLDAGAGLMQNQDQADSQFSLE